MSKKKNKLLFNIKFYGISAVVGAIIGFISNIYLKDFLDAHLNSPNEFINTLKIIGLIMIFFIGYFLHIIIHEAGHLAFGLITGYSFVSFRIGSLTLVKEDNKFKFKRYNIPGTAGQCLMMPPDLKDDTYPFILYNLGGIIINLIVAIVCLLSIIFIKGVPYPLNAILFLIGTSGLLTGLSNGIPMKIGGIPNDGYNVISMTRDSHGRRGFYLELKVYGLMCLGKRIKDFPLEMFKLREDSNLCNPLVAAIKLLEYYWYLDNMDFISAKACIDCFIPYIDKVPFHYKREINCERLFLELVLDCNKDIIDDLYDDILNKYLQSKYMINKKRIQMSYEGFYNKNKGKALKYYDDTQELAKKSPCKGEVYMELELVDWIKERL